jgi:hypothetical protein
MSSLRQNLQYKLFVKIMHAVGLCAFFFNAPQIYGVVEVWRIPQCPLDE